MREVKYVKVVFFLLLLLFFLLPPNPGASLLRLLFQSRSISRRMYRKRFGGGEFYSSCRVFVLFFCFSLLFPFCFENEI